MISVLLFLALCPSCSRNAYAVLPAPSPPSVDIAISSFFDELPTFRCGFSEDKRFLQKAELSILGLDGPSSKRILDSFVSSEPLWNLLVRFGVPDFIDQIEDLMDFEYRLNGTSVNSYLNSVSINYIRLLQSLAKVVFGDSSETNFSIPWNSRFLDDSEDCTDLTSGSQEANDRCRSNAEGIVHTDDSMSQSNPLTNLLRLVRNGEILLCIMAEIVKAKDTPENLGSILCRCHQACRRSELKCQFLSQLSTSLACAEKVMCPSVVPLPYVPPQNEYVNLPILAILPTPPQMSPAVINAERQTYYLLYKSIAVVRYDTYQAVCDPLYNSSTSISGWDVQLTANLVEKKPSAKADSVPFARLFSRPNGQHGQLMDFLISIRGTMSHGEWGLNWRYDQSVGPDEVPIHRGYLALASTAWGVFQARLQEASDAGRLGLITITGHSLGGGIASVMGHLASKQFSPFLPTTSIPRVRVVSFGGARAGGLKLTESPTVSFRSIEATLDPIPKLPCDSMEGCGFQNINVSIFDDLKTKTFTYAGSPGVVPITPLDVSPAFSNSPLPSIKVNAWHICAYDCWTSMHADPEHLGSCHAQNSTTTPNEACFFL